MLELALLRELITLDASHATRAAFLAAASGLVRINDTLYVVADDENHLGVFPVNGAEAGRLVRVFDGVLPDEHEERKAAKPDLEVLIQLPANEMYPHGALLALGSGSKRKRQRGVVLGLDAHGAIATLPRVIDFSELYAELEKSFDKLNIEGGFIREESLYLLQRGNKAANASNAVVEVALKKIWKALEKDEPVSKKALGEITPCTIGMVGDVPLCFTDAAVLPNGSWLFSAAAEATEDNYNDGEFVGGALGVVNANNQVVQVWPFDNRYKVEGITVNVEGDAVHVLMVTDADDATRAAHLLQVQLTGYPWK